MTSIRIHRRTVGIVAMALGVTAIAAPAASARYDLQPHQGSYVKQDKSYVQPAPTAHGQSMSAGPVVRPNPDQQAAQLARAAAARPAPTTWVVRPNPDQQAAQLARAAAARPAPTTWVVRPNPDQQTPPTAPVTIVRVTNPSGGFDWGDAGIGAAGTLGLILAATGGGLLLARRRNDPHTRTDVRTAS